MDRAVGRGGVDFIGEGPRSRTQAMLDKERANVKRILPEVPVNFIYVGPDPDATPLHRIVHALGSSSWRWARVRRSPSSTPGGGRCLGEHGQLSARPA